MMFSGYPMANKMKEKRHSLLKETSLLIGVVSVLLMAPGGAEPLLAQNSVGQVPSYSTARPQSGGTAVSSRDPLHNRLTDSRISKVTSEGEETGVVTTRASKNSPFGQTASGQAAPAPVQVRGQNPSLLDNISFIFKKDNKENHGAAVDSRSVQTGNGNVKRGAAADDSSLTVAESGNGTKIFKRRPLAERLDLDKVKPQSLQTEEAGTGSQSAPGKEIPIDKLAFLTDRESSGTDGGSSPDDERMDDLSMLSNKELLHKGDRSFDEKKNDIAERYYLERVARSTAKDGIEESLIDVYYRLGLLAKEKGDFQKAQDYLVLAIKSDPSKNPEITFVYSKILYEIEKYERAKKLFSYLTENHPEMDGPRYYLGLCLMNLEPGEEALSCLEETVGREKACRMIAAKSRELGRTDVAQEMEQILQGLRSDVETADFIGMEDEDQPLDIKNGDVLAVSNASAKGASDSSEAHDNPLEALGLDREQTTHINSPVINLETLGPKRIMVGQESEYKIVVENKSGQSAGDLVVRTDIPEGVEITGVNPSSGTSRISEKEPHNGELVCLWNLGHFDSNRKETLIFKFTPRIRHNINFVTSYDYEKTILKSGIEVTEPVLELTIEGNETIEWGVEEKYRMKIRNAGDGDAKNIRLTVSTGDNDNATRILKTLAPGEEKSLEINLKTVLDGTLVVRAAAEADYGFGADAEKTIDILRGRLDLFVEVPEIQFVNETTDYIVHVCNTGRANLQDIEVVAAIPTSIEVISATGNAARNNATNQLIWKIPSIKPEEEIVYQMNARMLRAGNSRLDVTAADKTGISGAGDAQVQIEAIAALEMKINKPSGAIALGKEVEYEVVISNSGTKAAEQIDAGFFLPSGMTPLAVDGGGKVIPEESKVLFNKVNFLGPGQTVTYKVRAVAEQRGNHKVQAVLESKGDNVQLVSEEMNFFYEKKTTLAKRDGDLQNLQGSRVAMNSQSVHRPSRPAAAADESAALADASGEIPERIPSELPNLPSEIGEKEFEPEPELELESEIRPQTEFEPQITPQTELEVESGQPVSSRSNLRRPSLELPANLPGPRTVRN